MASQPLGVPNEGDHSNEQGSYIDSVEDANSDADSAFGGSDAASISTSVTSSVFDYVYENGRRYHRLHDGEYIFPNDEKEQERLDMLHHIYLLLQGGNLMTAPISNPRNALDIGTGTGLWALDFADQFPNADVLGVDQSAIQPSWVAPNCRFLVDDLEQLWAYPEDQHFDYVHQRSLAGSIANWPRLYKQAFENLQPGGWLEIQEFDVWFHSQLPDDLEEDSVIMRWQKMIDEASVAMGRRLNCGEDLLKPMEDAGFTNIQKQIIRVPIGSWPKDPRQREIGQYLQLQMNQAIEAVTLGYFTRLLKWSETETKIFIAQVKTAFNDNSKLLYTYCRFFCGQKPKDAG